MRADPELLAGREELILDGRRVAVVRRAATTTRQTGSFVPPPRVTRMETDIAAEENSGADDLCRISWPR